MAERLRSRPWFMRLVFLMLCISLMFLHLLPLETLPRGWAGPDLMLAFVFAWVLRRPEYIPALNIALIFLLADLLLQRPPGLWAALVLMTSEILRRRAPALRDLPFSVEWINIATSMVAITVCYHLILIILLIETDPLNLSLMQLLMTILTYPLFVLISQTLFGVRKPGPGDVNVLRTGA